jgi:hypothetical protein
MSYEKYEIGLLSLLEQNFVSESMEIWGKVQKLQKKFSYKGPKKKDT